MFHEARSGFTSFTVHKLTFREDRRRDSSKAGERSPKGSSSEPPPTRPPPGNLDPTLGPVDWDEVEMQEMQVTLDNLEARRLAKE